jgi:hypothetical protein
MIISFRVFDFNVQKVYIKLNIFEILRLNTKKNCFKFALSK